MSRILLSELDDEIRSITQKIASIDCDEGKLESEEVRQKLAQLHCPFTWKPFNDAVECKTVMDTTEEKLSHVEDKGEEFTAWTTFVLNLILCYEYAKKEAMDYAFEKQEECHKIVEHAIARGFAVPVMGIGLKHVSDACKIFLLMKSKRFEEAAKALQEITEIGEMACREKASVWSVRGAMYLEYGLKGMKESIPFLDRALELDSECAEWHFLLGKALSRVRRIEDRTGIPDKRELRALENAVKMTDNTFYMVLLAQSYMDASRQVSWRNRKDSTIKPLCDVMNQQALEMYKKAYENGKCNSFILRRCAFGFMRLPNPWKDMELAKICILEGLGKHPTNCFLNHAASVFYHKQNEKEKAKYYCAVAAENGCYPACLEMMAIKQKDSKSYDPVPDMERYINIFKEKPHQEHLLALFGAFYYFERNDFNTALNHWLKVIDSDIDSVELESLQNSWPGAPHPCNISKTIINEIIKRLQESCSEEERIMYEKVIALYKKYHPNLVKRVQDLFYERSKLKNYYSAEQMSFPSPSHAWHNMTRNSVGNHWKVRPFTYNRTSK